MKLLCLLSFLLLTTFADAKNYYIAADGNDLNNGLTATTAWKTISKINNFLSMAAGDSILFKRGDSFYGTLLPSKSGIVFSDYGVGAKPIITGLTTISQWTSLGANIWEAVVPNGLSTLNMVIINGVLTPMGRYPNAGTANEGYLTYENFVNNTSITDNQLTATPNWTNAEIVVRRTNFTTDRAKITNHAGSTINFSTYAGGSTFVAGFGYFIQNHLNTLDQNGEWFYDAATKKIKIFYTSTPPAIQVATVANLVNFVNDNTKLKSGLKFKNLAFKGCEETLMNIYWNNNLLIDNCDFSFAGTNAIEYYYANYLTIQNCTIKDINMIGIHEYSTNYTSNITIKNNNISGIGMNAGMICAAYGEGVSSIGINVGSGNLLVKENVLDRVGYIGISLKANKDNQIIRKNIVTNYCSVKNDGGAIYNGGLRGSAIALNIVIDSNIISKAIGATGGSLSLYSKHARAIYLDASSYGVSILNNTIFDAWEGIYISQAQKIIIKGNTVYNTGNYNPQLNYFSAALVINDAFDDYQHVRNNTITNNIFFAKKPDQLLYYQTDRYNGVGEAGIIDNNYYINPTADLPIMMTNTTSLTLYSIPKWKDAFPKYDVHSKGSPVKIPLFTISKLIGKNKYPNQSFNSNIIAVTAESLPKVHTVSWDNTNQITGNGSLKLSSPLKSTNFTTLFQIIGAVENAKKYVLRFKTKATKIGTFQTNIRQFTGCYCINSPLQKGIIDTALQQHELLLSWDFASQTNAAVYIEFSQDNSTVFVDDMEFYEATVSPTNIDDYVRFDYNPTNTPKTIILDANYIGVDSTLYSGSVTIQPFSSLILIKTGNTTINLKANAGNDVSIILPTNSIILKGSANEAVTNYSWTKIEGPNQFTLTNPNSPSTTVSNLGAGKYTFQFKVINALGKFAFDTVTLTATGILPVTLIDFTAKNNNDNIDLKWQVASEINVSHYTIERSSTGQNFENIGQLNANNLLDIQVNYSFNDNFPLQGNNYYRLVMIDKDGTFTYSKTVAVAVKNAASFRLDNLTISAINTNVKIGINSNYKQVMHLVIADVNGRIIFTKPLQLQTGFNAIDNKIPTINTGIYYARLFTNKQVVTKILLSGR